MWQEVVNFLLNSIQDIGNFWNWLTSSVKIGSITMTPLSILGIGGFITIITLWIIKLVNPFS